MARPRADSIDSPCEDEPGWEPVGYDQSNVNTLTNILQQNASFLVNPCKYLNQWLTLVQFQVPQSTKDKVSIVKQKYLNSNLMSMIEYVEDNCYLMDIEDAASAVVNFDYFPIHITRLPVVQNSTMTAKDLFEYFRLNINEFINTGIANFSPYQDGVINDAALWNSTNPLNTLLHLNMVLDGSVIISKYESSIDRVIMTATTVRTPLDNKHPVSGHRTWGIAPDIVSGGYYFYTTATDRITGTIPTVLNTWGERLPIIQSGFESADILWTSLQTKMIKFINDNGGQAELYSYLEPNYIKRPNWVDIDLYLNNQISLDELRKRLGC